ncbi:hypothetical protein BRDID11002_54080 [Bradyrhizobium diazoefficiens]
MNNGPQGKGDAVSQIDTTEKLSEAPEPGDSLFALCGLGVAGIVMLGWICASPGSPGVSPIGCCFELGSASRISKEMKEVRPRTGRAAGFEPTTCSTQNKFICILGERFAQPATVMSLILCI